MKTEPETPREKATSRKRELIIEAAVECFIERGFHQTSIRDIAGAAGISVGNLYNHFASKSALILQLAELELGELDKFVLILEIKNDPQKVLAKFVDRFLDYSANPINAALMVEFFAEAVRNEDIGEAFMKNRVAVTNALKELIARGQKSGEFVSEIDADQSPEVILDIIEGFAMRSAQSKKRPDKIARKELHRIIERYLYV